jgi:hypothetical protein
MPARPAIEAIVDRGARIIHRGAVSPPRLISPSALYFGALALVHGGRADLKSVDSRPRGTVRLSGKAPYTTHSTDLRPTNENLASATKLKTPLAANVPTFSNRPEAIPQHPRDHALDEHGGIEHAIGGIVSVSGGVRDYGREQALGEARVNAPHRTAPAMTIQTFGASARTTSASASTLAPARRTIRRPARSAPAG